MAIDPSIKIKADNIRTKIYGKEVRESLASGLEEMSSDVVETVGRQDDVESQWQNVVDETTGKDVISAPEIIAARDGEANLKARLDKENQEVTAQLAETTQRLNDIALNVEDYPRLANETNDDGRFKRALADLKPYQTLIGSPDKIYEVKTIQINKSDVVTDGLRLKLIDGNNLWASVIQIIGTREEPVKNIKLYNTYIDGNRSNQTHIRVDSNGNATESRVGVGIYGVVSDVHIENIVSNYNAGDGIWLYSNTAVVENTGITGTSRTTDDDPTFRNITVKNGTFMFNRRHGGALDSVKGARFENCKFNNNGTDISGGLTIGDRGEPYNGSLYANGFDLEGYGNGTAFTDIDFVSCEFLNNASRAVSVTEPTADSLSSSYVQRGNILFQGCSFEGTDSEGFNLYVTPSISSKSNTTKYFKDMKLVDCRFKDGDVLFTSVEDGFFSNNQFDTTNNKNILLDYAKGVKLFNQVNINDENVYSENSEEVKYMMENHSITRPIISVDSETELSVSASNGTVAIITKPVSGKPYAWIMQGGAWRPMVQQFGPTTLTGGAPSGSIFGKVPLRDTDGTILGYIPVYE